MFIEKVNTVTGAREWTVADEDYDLAQEISCSRFGDMILDYDRNEKFLLGLRSVIRKLKAQDTAVHVLDIGTGTGLLSLIAMNEGADKVTAIEVFTPMARCAKKIVKNSVWKDKIQIIAERSTDLEHLDDKPNVIVAEVFDTELIGEGALRTFKEALQKLTKPNTRVVPSRAKVFILPLESSVLDEFTKVPVLPSHPSGSPLPTCPGTASVFDCQVSQLGKGQFRALSSPTLAFEFDFEDASKIHYDESHRIEIPVKSTGRVDAIVMWWELDMDGTGEHIIDMAPKWMNNDYQWRDHWMQAVYYLPNECHVRAGQSLNLQGSHDEFSFWFEEISDSQSNQNFSRPYCRCLLHSMLSKHSVFRINSVMQDRKVDEWLHKTCSNQIVACVGEGSLLGVQAAKHAQKVFIVEKNEHFRLIMSQYKRHYELENIEILDDLESIKESPSLLISEPFYLSSWAPWDNLHFWFDTLHARSLWPNIQISPPKGRLMAVCMHFDDLWKIASPVGVVNDFDLSAFDEISQKAREATEAVIDSQPLWEYSGSILSQIHKIADFDLTREPTNFQTDLNIPLKSGTNGIAFWMEWELNDKTWFSTGLRKSADEGESVWWKGVKQGVYFVPKSLQTQENLSFSMHFLAEKCEFVFQLC
ncbi:unnamed protein product, partial [Mesorhabditis belari]|uniref:Protein arginine N-methyltransferase n=1 Tax=Mesorhabditis belari TaxID=2138241 RepID=A0AAF3EAJ8_9BILA